MNPFIEWPVSIFLFIFGVSLPLYLIIWAVGLSGFKEITRYETNTSFFYRLNPVTKILLSVSVMIISAVSVWWIGLILTALMLGSYLTLLNPRRKFLLGLYLTIATVVGVTWGYAPFTPEYILRSAGLHGFNILWAWPSAFGIMGYEHYLTLQSVLYGFQISMRFTAVALSSLILVMTTTPSNILKALDKFKVPVTITFAIVVAMRSVPRIFESLDLAVKNQLLRGLGSKAPRIFYPYYVLLAAFMSLIPVMVHLFRGAKTTAISADTRAFRAYGSRTYLTPIERNRTDYIVMRIIAVALIATVISVIMGFGRSFFYIA